MEYLIYESLGNCYRVKGKLDDAKESLEVALEISRKIKGDYTLETANIL
jgi:tetratricopeptide (TPR) repeat protein